jgi:RimJ/RimL family protein N-acetyltransferase
MTPQPSLTDGVIWLRPMTLDDARAHLAGEDDDQLRWLPGAHGSIERVRRWIERNHQQWRNDGPNRHFGIYDVREDALIGNAAANLRLAGLQAGEVNLSYAVFPEWRGRGVAVRAVDLICDWLARLPGCTRAVIGVAPGNTFSHRVPRNAGFSQSGEFISLEGGLLIRYERPL